MNYDNAIKAYAERAKQFIREWTPETKFLLTKQGLKTLPVNT